MLTDIINSKKNDSQGQHSASPRSAASKWTDLSVRFLSAVVLALVQAAVVCGGRNAIFFEILVIQFVAFHEFVRVGRQSALEHQLPLFLRAFPYLVALVASYALSGPYILRTYAPSLARFADYNTALCFGAASLLLVLFVVSLNPVNMAYAYIRLAWTAIGAMIIIVPANLYARVPRASLFWFLMSAVCVIMNDTLAYFCGRMFGRTPLIALSPKKTVEGFIGALLLGAAAAFFAPVLAERVPFLYCNEAQPFDFKMQCELPREFSPAKYNIAGVEFVARPVQIHSIAFSLFSSLVAPFGGFLGSGLKRIYGIKDFGKIIPGHGGIIDRVDCQFVMGIFAYIYIKNFVNKDI